MTSGKRLLLLGGPLFQIPVVNKAREMGLRVGVADINRNAPAISIADEGFEVSIKDFDAMLDVADRFRPDGIMAGACDTGVVTVAKLCAKLGLAGNSVDSAIHATDKVAMLKAFDSAGVAHPRFQVIRSADIESGNAILANDLEYPVITKPVDSAGGRGVNLVTEERQLILMLRSSAKYGNSGDVLVEETMVGPEVSVEMLVIDGEAHVIQVTDKATSGAPFFFEIGHSQPTQLGHESREAISNLAKDAAYSIGLVNSPAHVEIILTDDGPKMVEMGARLGGDYITSLLCDASVRGVSMSEAAIRMAFGERVDITGYGDSGTAVAVRFIPSREGRVVSIRGVGEAGRTPGVIAAQAICRVGDRFEKARDDSSRLGYVVATADDATEAMRVCEKALSMVDIEVI